MNEPRPLTLLDFGYAPGNYSCICFCCSEEFIGDKRASQCEGCATMKLRRSMTQLESRQGESPSGTTSKGVAVAPKGSAPESPALLPSNERTPEQIVLLRDLREAVTSGRGNYGHRLLCGKAAEMIEALIDLAADREADSVRLHKQFMDAKYPEHSETAGDCPIGIKRHDICSAGTCKTCVDAARYRWLRDNTYVEGFWLDGAGGVDTKVRVNGSVQYLDRSIDAAMSEETPAPATPAPRDADVEDVMGGLYASELNFSVSCFWDAGYDVKLGDHLNGFKAAFTALTLGEVAQGLTEAACKHYPDSQFAAQVKTSAEYGAHCRLHPGAMFKPIEGCPTCEVGGAPYVLDAEGNAV